MIRFLCGANVSASATGNAKMHPVNIRIFSMIICDKPDRYNKIPYNRVIRYFIESNEDKKDVIF